MSKLFLKFGFEKKKCDGWITMEVEARCNGGCDCD